MRDDLWELQAKLPWRVRLARAIPNSEELETIHKDREDRRAELDRRRAKFLETFERLFDA